MTRRKKVWLGLAGGLTVAIVGGIYIAASMLSKRVEPFLREQAVLYLQERFQSDVQLHSLHLRVPKLSALELYRTRGVGSIIRVTGEGLALRFRGETEKPPLFGIGAFSFEVDLGSLWERKPIVRKIVLDRMAINIPPKGNRPPMMKKSDKPAPKVVVEDVLIREAKLQILPKDPNKRPLDFNIAELKLTSDPNKPAMHYQAKLTNPKPPGQIDSSGSFGPWVADEPGNGPLAGKYTFSNADLGVFSGIAGILQSTGEFTGTLDQLNVKGQANVPDFRLKMAENRVPLKTQFEALVDGTNGNTVLKPVRALLGSTSFTTSGAIIRHEGAKRRSIDLDVSMPKGYMRDVLRLATKGPLFMEGRLNLKTRLSIPPLTGKVKEKLVLDGRFEVTDGHFLKSNIQDQIDNLSRRAQGQPSNQEVDEVFSTMRGRFHLENEALRFSTLTFGVPGADVAIAGVYDLADDTLDFHGALKLKAKVSQTMTGWKRWALKPVDPFFARKGAGTYLKIKIDGSTKKPSFGPDLGGHDHDEARPRQVSEIHSSGVVK